MNKTDTKRMLSNNISEKDWVGVVVDNKDPESSFRCKINVFGLFDGIETEHLPWAFPSSNVLFSGNGGFGCGSVPKIGTIVKVRFTNGSKYAPEYHSIQNINKTLQNELADDYDGAHVLLYDETENLKITFQRGTGIKIDYGDSNINIKPNKEIHINHSNDKNKIILTDKIIDISSSKEVNINCQNIKLGKNAVESVIKGESFKLFFDTHIHPAPGAPPVLQMPSTILSKNTKTK